MLREKLRSIPSVTLLLDLMSESCPQRRILKFCIDEYLRKLRSKIMADENYAFSTEKIIHEIRNNYSAIDAGSLKRVINATGVLLHTNLGRAPISREIFDRAADIISTYCNIEYDLEKGKRGERYSHISDYFKILTGAEDALVVNNNAAAVFLILNTFAKKKEVIISRGELVEIGGSFRIPEVMKNSGAILKEVGTTNKTRNNDYSDNITNRTSILMKVHKSNYEIVGFTEEAESFEIPRIASAHDVISYFDMGSGFIGGGLEDICPDLDVKKTIEAGFDLVSISGDKLLGTIQCGVILGKKQYIDKIRKNQLLRMLRVDKVTLGILQESLKLYLKEGILPAKYLHLFQRGEKELMNMAENLLGLIGYEKDFALEHTKGFLGGGSCPLKEIDSVALVYNGGDSVALERKLRTFKTPVITRTYDKKVYLDLLAVSDEEINILAEAVRWALM